MPDARDAALIDALVERGVLRSEAEGLLQRADARGLREQLKQRVIPVELKGSARWEWCEKNGGHLDNGGMFYSTCLTCGYEDD